ncbi:MAG: hypothetical protein AAF206_27590 [Bacteroidota bacterium]
MLDNATEQELIELTNHPNPITRYYAFWALTERKASKATLLEIVKTHLNDTVSVKTQIGCIGGETMIGDYMLSKLPHSDQYKLDEEEQRMIDSLLFWGEGNRIRHRNSIFDKLGQSPQHYTRLKELVEKDREAYALMPLLQYGVEEDQQLIKMMFPVSAYHALLATKLYPHTEHIPFINALQREAFEPASGQGEIWTLLYETVMQFAPEEALDMLMFTYTDQANFTLKVQHARFIYAAVKDADSPVFDPIKREVVWYLGKMSQEYLDEVWALDSAGIYQLILKRIAEESNRYMSDDLFHLYVDRLEQKNGDSSIHIMHAAIQNATASGGSIERLFARAKKYQHPQTGPLITKYFVQIVQKGSLSLNAISEAILQYDDQVVFRGIEATVFDNLQQGDLKIHTASSLFALAFACNSVRTISLITDALIDERWEEWVLGEGIRTLLNLEDKAVNQKLLDVYLQKEWTDSNIFLRQRYRILLEHNGLVAPEGE